MTINTLEEARAYLDYAKEHPEMLQDNQLSEFAILVDNVATNILKDKPDEYMVSMLSLVQSMALMCLMDDNPMLAVAVMKNIESFNEYATYVLKFVVGLSAMEELR